MKRCVPIAIVLAASAIPLSAATLERLSLDDMIAKSTAIVRATVTGVKTEFTGRDIFTHYQIQVSERFKGPTQKTFDIRVPGGSYGTYHQTAVGSPVLTAGSEYVLFLWTSKSGVTWITGMTQGLFQLGGDTAGDPTASRAASGELMLDPATARPVRDEAVSFKLSILRSRIAARLSQGGVQ